jgi:lipopolysaccharide export system protein LptA
MMRSSAVVLALFVSAAAARAATFSFSGDRMETVMAEGRERTLLTGSAEVVTEDNRIRAEEMELYGENFRYIRCRGDVQVLNEKKGIELSCDELFYNRDKKLIRVTGSVVMLDKKNEIVVKGGFLENWEERDETIVQIGVRILKKDLVCRSEYARYFREEDRLELSGMPRVTWKGDEYTAMRITIDLAEDTIRLEGDIRGEVKAEKEGGASEGAASGGATEGTSGGSAPQGSGSEGGTSGGGAPQPGPSPAPAEPSGPSGQQ